MTGDRIRIRIFLKTGGGANYQVFKNGDYQTPVYTFNTTNAISDPLCPGVAFFQATYLWELKQVTVNKGLGNYGVMDWGQQVVGSGKPADNATVGADWANNLANRFHLQLMQKFLSREELADWVASRNGKKKEAKEAAE